MVQSKYDKDLGELLPSGEGHFETRNVIKPSFHWPSKSTSRVQNLLLINTTIQYDHIHERMFSPLGELKSCGIASESCQSVMYTLVWSWTEKKLCPNYLQENEEKESKVELHYHVVNSTNNGVTEVELSHLDIPELGLTYFTKIECPVLAHTCFGDSRVLCLSSGDFLLMRNCSGAFDLDFYKSNFVGDLRADWLAKGAQSRSN